MGSIPIGGLRIINRMKEVFHMAKRQKVQVGEHHARERIAYGIFVSVLGCLWLVSELGWIKTTFPIGPFIIIIVGFAMMLPWLKK